MTVQFVDGHFVDSYYPTIENTFSKMIKYKNQDYATEIIDTAGQVHEVFFSPRVATPSPAPHPTPALPCSHVCRQHGQVEKMPADLDAHSQDEYSILNSKHFIGIHGYMIVYSVASKQSFEMARIIRDKILNHLVSAAASCRRRPMHPWTCIPPLDRTP